MSDTVVFQCVNCRDAFTQEAAIVHAQPERCCEWSNHMMTEANFKIIVNPDPTEVFICADPKEA